MKNNLAILLIFFARPNTLSEVFEAVRKAKPSKLFLACDGPRKGNSNDAKMIEECKKIVQNVDWDCEVHTKYSEENLGCGQGPSSAISWAFEFVDKLVILEDDCVPDESFFPYMEEMLDKYEHDERIGIISGFNHFKDWDCAENSYFFTKCGATLGWGTWKRVWDKYDYHIEGINDEYLSELLKEEIIDKKGARVRIKDWKKANKETTPPQNDSNLLYSNIVPTKEIKPIDTTGAGDAFFGALLANISGKDLSEEIIEKALVKANEAGANATQFIGAVKI